mgnify:CR=1 FL=1
MSWKAYGLVFDDGTEDLVNLTYKHRPNRDNSCSDIYALYSSRDAAEKAMRSSKIASGVDLKIIIFRISPIIEKVKEEE